MLGLSPISAAPVSAWFLSATSAVTVYNYRFDITTGQIETSFETTSTSAPNIALDLNTGKFIYVITPRVIMTL